MAAVTPPRPIGLIGSYVGGTPDEAWSSPDALKKCLRPRHASGATAPNTTREEVKEPNSVLWNGMINPLTRSTIKGAVW